MHWTTSSLQTWQRHFFYVFKFYLMKFHTVDWSLSTEFRRCNTRVKSEGECHPNVNSLQEFFLLCVINNRYLVQPRNIDSLFIISKPWTVYKKKWFPLCICCITQSGWRKVLTPNNFSFKKKKKNDVSLGYFSWQIPSLSAPHVKLNCLHKLPLLFFLGRPGSCFR